MLLFDICVPTQSGSPIMALMLQSFTWNLYFQLSFNEAFVSSNQFFFLVYQVFFVFFSVRLFHQCHSAWKNSSQTKESTETTKSGCNASNFLLSRSLNVCALSLPLHRRINLLFHLRVPPSSHTLIHLISASWWVQSPPSFSASSVRPALPAAPYSGDVVSLGVIVPVAGRSIGRNCVAATVELRRGGTNWILAQSM